MPMQATTTTPLFAAQLTPHRAMSPRAGWVVASLTALLFGSPGLLFLSLGAWPVTGLMVLTALAIIGALVVALRRGKRREQITVWSDQIEFQTTDSLGETTMRRLDPTRVRLLLTRDADEKTTAVRLRDGKDELELGAFLTPEDKSSFAKALGTALRRARS